MLLKTTVIAASALFAATFLAQPQAQAAPAAGQMPQIETTASVQLVHGRERDRDRHRDWRRDRRHDRDWRHRDRWDRPHFRGHRLHGYGYRKFGHFRWDGRGFVTRAYHPRYGWVWVRVSANSGRPLAYWR